MMDASVAAGPSRRGAVQEELSRCLAKLLWCLTRTEKEDEYAAQLYLDKHEEQDEEEDVVMEEHVHTLDENSSWIQAHFLLVATDRNVLA